MKLFEALNALSEQLSIDFEALLRYAGEYHDDPERKFMYAIVRAIGAQECLELGTDKGKGTHCIIEAIRRNGGGHVLTVDIRGDVGEHLTPEDMPFVTVFQANIDLWIAHHRGDYDFIFEDGAHSIHQVQEIYKFVERLLNPGGVILSHDAAVEGVGAYVAEGQMKSGYSNLPVYQIEDIPWGFSVYRKGQS